MDGIAKITGHAYPQDKPVAELWMGTHPLGPCYVKRDNNEKQVRETESSRVSLATIIEQNPEEMLGQRLVDQYGSTLPFLFKILSAAQPLSLQVHPNREKAQEGFDRETAAGIPVDSPERSYRDKNPKSELILALTPFTCLCGFREVSQSIAYLSALTCNAFLPALSYLRTTNDYRGFLEKLLSLSDEDKKAIAHNASALAISKTADMSPYSSVSYLSAHYPDDIGILAPLYLNSYVLSPGEALFLNAGMPHTYLEGTALELMSNSDNVLRGGLTKKKVNSAEFLDVLDPTIYDPKILVPTKETSSFKRYQTPCVDFELSYAELQSSTITIPTEMPALLLITEGSVMMSCPALPKWKSEASRGSVHFIPAAAPLIEMSGTGTAYLASLPHVAGNKL